MRPEQEVDNTAAGTRYKNLRLAAIDVLPQLKALDLLSRVLWQTSLPCLVGLVQVILAEALEQCPFFLLVRVLFCQQDLWSIAV